MILIPAAANVDPYPLQHMGSGPAAVLSLISINISIARVPCFKLGGLDRRDSLQWLAADAARYTT